MCDTRQQESLLYLLLCLCVCRRCVSTKVTRFDSVFYITTIHLTVNITQMMRKFSLHIIWKLSDTQLIAKQFPVYLQFLFLFQSVFVCSVRSNSNILTRRLCRNRSYDDNELYRSNSFKFERFRREETNESNINTLPKQVCTIGEGEDYELEAPLVMGDGQRGHSASMLD